ncbi:MAG: potassium/proton antiporter [Lentisphaeria bacterium]|nr:potassium/proton antiporter [Lentisphaeria bacterium]
MSFDAALTIVGVLLLAGAMSCKISSRFNLPTLLLFLAAGAAAEWLLPISGETFVDQINRFGILAMAYILYSGGLETDIKAVRTVAFRGLILASGGVFLTALLMGGGAFLFFGNQYSFLWCLLLGSLISSTDAAAVFAILRGRSVGLKGDLQPLLEFESGSNDPMAAFLTLMMCVLCCGGEDFNWFVEIPLVVYKLGGGVLLGIFCGWAGKYLFRVKLDFEGLYFVISVALVVLCYGVAQMLGTNGFMACYVCGVCMNGSQYNYKRGLVKFHNALAWLMQIGLFILLGFLAQPKSLFNSSVVFPGVVLGLFLMFIARPLAVFICLAMSHYTFREKLFISWVGIRGAAPVVLATFPLALGVEDAQVMFRLIFFIVILSVTIQGWTLMAAARRLRVARAVAGKRDRAPLELEIMHGSCDQEMREFEVSEDSELAGKTLAEIAFPSGVLVTMIRRNERFIPARAATCIERGDGLLIMAEHRLLRDLEVKYFKNNHI